MKVREIVLAGAVAAALCGASHAKSSDDWSCAYCGVGQPVVVPELDPVIIETPVECAFCGTGGYSGGGSADPGANWSRAATWSVYLVDGDGTYAGTATITTSKRSSKGKVSVKVAFKLATGKTATAKKAQFAVGEDGTIVARWGSVKNVGAVALELSPDGEVGGTAGPYEFSSTYDADEDEWDDEDDEDDEVFVHGAHTFAVDAGDYDLDEKYELIDETIPSAVEVVTSGKKWSCGGTPSVKYKKVDGEYELVGLDDENKPNVSGLKVTFDAKKGTFKGSFKVYATNEGSIEKGKPKLKSFTFSLTGRVSGGQCVGTATCKKLKASWPLVVE